MSIHAHKNGLASMRLLLHFPAAILLALAIGALRSTAPAAEPASAFTWKSSPGSVALQRGPQTVWQFNFGTNATKPFFHPVAPVNGPELTWDRPPDHLWHHALWFSWKFINAVNYWEENPKSGVADGRTKWEKPKIETHPDGSARISLELSYHPTTNSQPVLIEHRVIEISAPGKDGSFHQDWTMTFTAGTQDVLLDRTPLPNEPNGKPYGGYAGLSARLASNIVDRTVVTTEGPVDLTGGRYRGKAMAADYSGKFASQEAGIAMIDSPSNTNSPSPWYVISDRTMSYFSPAVLCYQPLPLRAGASFTLRYRVVVHPGRWDAVRLRDEAKLFSVKPPSSNLKPSAARSLALPSAAPAATE